MIHLINMHTQFVRVCLCICVVCVRAGKRDPSGFKCLLLNNMANEESAIPVVPPYHTHTLHVQCVCVSLNSYSEELSQGCALTLLCMTHNHRPKGQSPSLLCVSVCACVCV